MGRKAKKSTTGWRQRYLVNVQKVPPLVDVWLMRGRMKKDERGALRALLSVHPHTDWKWMMTGSPFENSLLTHHAYERDQRDQMIADLALLRMQGYTIRQVPSW